MILKQSCSKCMVIVIEIVAFILQKFVFFFEIFFLGDTYCIMYDRYETYIQIILGYDLYMS